MGCSTQPGPAGLRDTLQGLEKQVSSAPGHQALQGDTHKESGEQRCRRPSKGCWVCTCVCARVCMHVCAERERKLQGCRGGRDSGTDRGRETLGDAGRSG